jgi:hypothetical protein
MDDEIENAILSNLKKLKQDTKPSEENVKNDPENVEINDNPDELIKLMPKISQTQNVSFDYLAKKSYFDQIYFKNSKLIKL